MNLYVLYAEWHGARSFFVVADCRDAAVAAINAELKKTRDYGDSPPEEVSAEDLICVPPGVVFTEEAF